MMRFTFAVATLLTAFGATAAQAQDQPSQGLEAGKPLPATFHSFHINGKFGIQRDDKGKMLRNGRYHSSVAQHGINPVVMIFAREPQALADAELKNLLMKLDAAVDKDQKAGDGVLGAFVVILSPSETSAVFETELNKDNVTKAPDKLVENAVKRKLLHEQLEKLAAPFKHVIISSYPPAGPKDYNLSDKAAVTVVVYNRLNVAELHSLTTGMTPAVVDQIMKEVNAIMKKR